MPQDQVSALQGVQQVPLREKVIGTGPPPAGSTPRSSSSCPAAAPRPSSPPAQPRRAPTRGARCPATSAATSTRTEPPSRPAWSSPSCHATLNQATLRAIVSAQVRLLRREKLQASAPPNQPGSNSGPTRVSACPRFSFVSRAAGRTQWMWQPTDSRGVGHALRGGCAVTVRGLRGPLLPVTVLLLG